MKTMNEFFAAPVNLSAALAGIFFLAIASAAPAEEKIRPCADEASRLCKDVQPGEGRVAQCLKEHESELSPACKKNIAKVTEKGRKLKQACEGDKERLCKDTQPGDGKIMQCLKQHEAELSAACKEQMSRPKDRKK